MLRLSPYIIALFSIVAVSLESPTPMAQASDDAQIYVAQADTDTAGEEGTASGTETRTNPAAGKDEASEEGIMEDADDDFIEEPPAQRQQRQPPIVEEEEDYIEDEELAPEPEFFGDDVFEEIAPEDKGVIGPKKITIDMVIYVDYQFFDSSDAFKVKYHINMGGSANLSTALIKGTAEIATEVTGFLAKWPQGQCILNVSIAKVPYEITYQQTASNEADLNITFKQAITENWTSTCTFIGASATRPFKTQGPPEQWIAGALERASPPISAIVTPVGENETTSVKFDIPEYTVIEENLGSATVKGTGIVSIEPKKGATPAANTEPTSSLKRSHPLPSKIERPPALPMPPQKQVPDLARRKQHY